VIQRIEPQGFEKEHLKQVPSIINQAGGVMGEKLLWENFSTLKR
jgi:hypothetical protein